MTVVIGHGIVGCYAASVLAMRGDDVTVIGSGTTATSLSTGCLSGDPRLAGEVAAWLGPGFTHGDIESLTGRGNPHRSVVAPSSTRPEGDGPITAVCLGDMGGMGPDWLAAIGLDVIDLDVRARSWSALRERPDRALRMLLEAVEGIEGRVMIPPFLGRERLEDGMSSLRGSADVFEAVVPMATPGIRLQEACVEAAASCGCRFLDGRRVDRIVIDGDEVVAVRAYSGMRSETIPVSRLVVAYGGLVGGALEPEWTGCVDSLGAFRTSGDAIDVDDEGRPMSRNGTRCRNAVVLGAAQGHGYDGRHGAMDALSETGLLL